MSGDYAAIVAAFSDDALRDAAAGFVGRASSLAMLRDLDGKPRSLTDAEETFGRLVRVEYRRRFLDTVQP